jgi:hypothetical protein
MVNIVFLHTQNILPYYIRTANVKKISIMVAKFFLAVSENRGSGIMVLPRVAKMKQGIGANV